MKRLTATEVHAQKVEELGLDPTAVDLTSIEAIAGAIRRTASFLCPCAASTLVRGVVRPLRGLVDDLAAIREVVKSTLEAIVAHGDIIEQSEFAGVLVRGTGALLYAAPPSFVLRQTGVAILLGIATDQLSVLPDELEARIEYITHVRRLSPLPTEDLRSELVQLGLIELSYDHWLKAPLAEPPRSLIARLDSLLDEAHPSREVPGLLLLEPERPVLYYRGRWMEPGSQTGRFVGRRRQAYGADLWSYVQLQDGNPECLIDFPIVGSRWRGCDEAWRLQMAIDACRGNPQRFRICMGPRDTMIIEFFSPVPMWARRRWDVVGELVDRSRCLFAYRLPSAECEEELRFAREALWLKEITASA